MSQPIRIDTKPTAAQAQAVIDAGPGSTVYHPWARGGRRKQLEQALGRAGVPHRLVRSLGWTTRGPAAPAVQNPDGLLVDDVVTEVAEPARERPPRASRRVSAVDDAAP